MGEETIVVRLPKLGESILTATVVQWMKKEGDLVAKDEPLLEVATDKVNSEIPSPVAGVLQKVMAGVQVELEIGAPLAHVRPLTQGETRASEPHKPEAVQSLAAPSGFLSPAVLHAAKESNISLEEIGRIRGTGQGGRVTKQDIQSYQKGSDERIPMSPMRKAIAQNMTRSFFQAPHAYIVTEIDVTDLNAHIAQHKQTFFQEHGVKLTITPFVVQAMARALQTCPHMNASLEEETLVVKKDVNVGIAVAVDEGVMVPVVRDCQKKSLIDIAKSIGDLSARVRARSLHVDEVAGGSITLTNFGMSGAIMGLPIIRHPEVAIVGIGAIEKRVVVFDDDRFGVRQIVHATLSFDHRALDGMYAGRFLQALKEQMEVKVLS